MTRLCKKYIELLSSDAKGSERFWGLARRILEDKKRTSVVAEMRRSRMIYNITELVADEAISMDDLDDFSDDVKEAVRILLRQRID